MQVQLGVGPWDPRGFQLQCLLQRQQSKPCRRDKALSGPRLRSQQSQSTRTMGVSAGHGLRPSPVPL